MSTSYRKSPGGRRHVKLTSNQVIEVVNGLTFSMVHLFEDNEMIRTGIEDDKSLIPGIEEEFNQAYKYAFDRISLQKLDI